MRHPPSRPSSTRPEDRLELILEWVSLVAGALFSIFGFHVAWVIFRTGPFPNAVPGAHIFTSVFLVLVMLGYYVFAWRHARRMMGR
jgi:hypothetical protein